MNIYERRVMRRAQEGGRGQVYGATKSIYEAINSLIAKGYLIEVKGHTSGWDYALTDKGKAFDAREESAKNKEEERDQENPEED